MSFKIEVIADSSGEWVGNGLRFATEQEAGDYAWDLAARWMLVTDTRVVTSDDVVNARILGGRMEHLREGEFQKDLHERLKEEG